MEKGADGRAGAYSVIKNRAFFLDLFTTILVLLILQLSGASEGLRLFASRLSTNSFAVTAVYATFFGAILYIAGLPLGFYKGYVVEHRFGLSNQRLSGWVKDEIKKVIISYVIFLIFVEFLYYLLRSFPYNWWLLMAGGWILLGIIFAKIVPVLIIPLFYKYSQLENKGLKTKLMRLAEGCGVKVLNVFKLDLSSKTKKANAALTGMGNTRRIILGDTLLDNYTEEEIEVVMAHELAHHKFRHIWRTLVFGAAFTILSFYIIKLSLARIVLYLGFDNIYNISLFPSIILLLSLFGIVTMPVQNWYSRVLEKQADLAAITMTKKPQAFISCMNKLAKQNLANVSPSKFIEVMLYNHPPISKRVAMARKLMKTSV